MTTQLAGAMALVLVGAAGVGALVYYALAPRRGAFSFSLIAAIGFVGTLAYMGVEAAGAIVWVMMLVLVLVWALAAFVNS